MQRAVDDSSRGRCGESDLACVEIMGVEGA